MICFVAGIDTGVGKTIATGLLARQLRADGRQTITQKVVQTGSSRPAEDIVKHREIMGIPLTAEDESGLTCPYVFSHPASPHLAARLEGQTIDPDRITDATQALARIYDTIVLEGAGGLHVPLNDSLTLLEYLTAVKYPTILVSSSRLGSINHTFMSLELLKHHEIPVLGLVYNRFGEADRAIGDDSKAVFETRLSMLGYPAKIVEINEQSLRTAETVRFSSFLE